MRGTRSDRLAVVLIALAGLNVGVLDQVGHGLVADVQAKYEELGADWIVLRQSYSAGSPPLDAALLADIAALPGIEEVTRQVTAGQVLPGGSEEGGTGGFTFTRILVTEFVLLDADTDLSTHPYLYTLFEDKTEGTAFYRNEIVWVDGGPPAGPMDAALPLKFAAARGLSVGDALEVEWGKPLSFGPPAEDAPRGENRTFHVRGIYQPIPTGNIGEDSDRILVRPDDALSAAVATASGNGPPSRLILLVRAGLDDLEHTVAALRDLFARHGLTLEAPGFVGGGFRSAAPAVAVAVADNTTGWSGASPLPELPDVELFANDDLVTAAFSAADRAGTWFRFLAAGSVIIAAIGIASIVRSETRRVARRVGVQQALGFTADRLLARWATRSIAVASVGAALALLIVVLTPVAGLDRLLFGMRLQTDTATLVLVPLMAIVLFLAAGLPHVARLVRRPPAHNLREVEGR